MKTDTPISPSHEAHMDNIDRVVSVFSVFDAKARTFSPPHLFTAKGIALRTFSDMVTDEKTTISKHPIDFYLYYLGTFNETSGLFVSVGAPVQVAHGLDFVNS